MAEGEDKLFVQRRGAEEFSRALERGEIDRGFFDEREWNLFLDDLHRWKTCTDIAQPEQNKKLRFMSTNICKRLLKRILCPFARLGKKIVYKLMGSVLFSIENDIVSLRLHVDETARDMQDQIFEHTAGIQYSLREVKVLSSQIHEELASIMKSNAGSADSAETDEN